MSGFSGRQRSFETLFWEYTNAGNPGSTDRVSTSSFSLPAGLLARDGDEIVIETDFVLSAATSTKGWGANIGHSAHTSSGFTGGTSLFSFGTSTASQSIRSETIITRTGASEAQYRTFCRFSGTSVSNAVYATATVNWANAQNIAAEAYDTGSDASAITIKQIRITLRRAP